MAAHLFNESGQMQEVDIPDIFDVLEGGEDENAVKFLLGFASDEPMSSEQVVNISGQTQSHATAVFTLSNSVSSDGNDTDMDGMLTKEGKPRKRDPVDPSRCIYSCENCNKAFTTKFNLKRHINLHCNPSKEAGVPVQGPPSASMPSRKARERREAMAALGIPYTINKGRPPKNKKNGKATKATKSKRKKKAATTATPATTSISTIVVTQASLKSQTKGQPAVVTVQSMSSPTTVTYQVGNQSQQPQQTLNFQNKQLQKQSIGIRVQAPNGQQQHHHQQQQHPQKEQTFQMVKMVPQQQLIQPQQPKHQLYHQRVVQKCNSIKPIPNVPVPYVPSASTVVYTQGSIHIAGQPISNIQSQFRNMSKPRLGYARVKSVSSITPAVTTSPPTVTTSPPTITTSTTVPTPAPVVSTVSIPPTTTTTNGSIATSNGLGTVTASIISSTFMPTTCATTTELSRPPEELFDSEDDDDDRSSVATTTEAPSPAGSINGDNFPTMYPGDQYSDEKETPVQYNLANSTVVNVIVTSNNNMEVEVEENDTNASLNLPSNPQRGQLEEIPRGWLRKIITTGKIPDQPKVFYYNTMGKKFSSQDEINQYFSRLGQTVRPGLFNFDPPKLVDEDDDDDEDDDLQENVQQQSFGNGLQQKQTLLA